MTDFDYTRAAVAVTDHERKSARLESTYVQLVKHFGLTPKTDSKSITAAARKIVLDGAHNDKTATGAALIEDDLTGRDPGADSKVRDYWKAARAVRIGLVTAIGPDDTPKPQTLRVSLSGEGGGSTVVPADHPLYPALVMLIGGVEEG